MKKSKLVATTVVFLVSGLLLAGCELPKNLESIIKWRQTWYSSVTSEEIQKFLSPIIFLMVAIILLKGLLAILRDINNGVPFVEGGAAVTFIQLIAVASLYSVFQWANTITDKVLPPNITIDTVLKNLSLTLSLDPAKAITSIWALNFSIVMGLCVSFCLVTDFLIFFAILIADVIKSTTKSVWFLVATLLGHAIYISLFVFVESLMTKFDPKWNFISVASVRNLWFVGTLLVLMATCYFALPVSVSIGGLEVAGPKAFWKKRPGLYGEGTVSENSEGGRKINIEPLYPIFLNQSQTSSPQEKDTTNQRPESTTQSSTTETSQHDHDKGDDNSIPNLEGIDGLSRKTDSSEIEGLDGIIKKGSNGVSDSSGPEFNLDFKDPTTSNSKSGFVISEGKSYDGFSTDQNFGHFEDTQNDEGAIPDLYDKPVKSTIVETQSTELKTILKERNKNNISISNKVNNEVKFDNASEKQENNKPTEEIDSLPASNTIVIQHQNNIDVTPPQEPLKKHSGELQANFGNDAGNLTENNDDEKIDLI